MKRLLCALLACLFLTGCTAPADPAGSASSGSSGDSSVTEPEPFRAEPVDFTWKPKVYSDYQRQGEGEEWGPEKEQLYYDCVDAMLAGVESVPCPKEENFWSLMPLMQSNFPVMRDLICDLYYEDGQVHLVYELSAEKREQIVRAFADKIESYIEDSVCQGDTPTMAALALYHNFTTQLEYDHEAVGVEDTVVDVTPYRALMTGEGICQSFGPAYAYLCMQLGINAVEAGGTDINEENGHSWSMLELNGHHYFADPTFEAGMDDVGLQHFAMNEAQRMNAGSYPLEKVGLGFNLMPASKFDLSDGTFAPLWSIRRVTEITRTSEGMVVKGLGDYSGQDVIPIEDGKTLTVISTSMAESPMGETFESLIGTSWMFAGGDLAFLDGNVTWIDSQSYTGPAQCILSADDQLILETPEGDWTLLVEDNDRMILKGEHGDVPATRTAKEEFDRLRQQYQDDYNASIMG